MASSDIKVAIVGGGAAGIAAGRRLHDAKVDCLIIEARSRLGGRAWTLTDDLEFPIDLGCGWLHSADLNPWTQVALAQGRVIDKTPPPWRRISLPIGFPPEEQAGFFKALEAFYDRLDALPESEPDVPATAFLDPKGRWNTLINAISTYANGAELESVSARDFARYTDTGINWRAVDGYGALIAAHAAGVPVAFDCPVRRIDHSGARLKLETANGTITADAAIITLPSTVLAEEKLLFAPALHEKTEAAAGLPLGYDDKLFLALSEPDEFDKESRLFGHTDRSRTATYHFRPFGRPCIEAYFGGPLAAQLEAEGERAFFDFAVSELVGVLGSDFAGRVKLIGLHRWGADPFARGAYSHALPGKADCRRVLAAPVDDRLFFAGEACSLDFFSTAHGAYFTGVAAADQAIASRRRRGERGG